MTSTAPRPPVLLVEGVSRRFDDVRALNDLDLSVGSGERVALLGHNGAGKTTLFRLVLGFIAPDQGSLSIDGHSPGSHPARDRVAYLPESVAFPRTLTGFEILRLYAVLKGVPVKRCAALLEAVGLSAAARRRVGDYSKGMRQRLGLAQALLGSPRLLLLDEPTSGLDPVSRHDFYALVDSLASGGTAVLQSSHSLAELTARTDRIAILEHGKLLANAPLSELQARAQLPLTLRIQTHADQVEFVATELSTHLSANMTCRVLDQRRYPNGLELQIQPEQKMQMLRHAAALGARVRDIDILPPSLDSLYRHYCHSPPAEAEADDSGDCAVSSPGHSAAESRRREPAS